MLFSIALVDQAHLAPGTVEPEPVSEPAAHQKQLSFQRRMLLQALSDLTPNAIGRTHDRMPCRRRFQIESACNPRHTVIAVKLLGQTIRNILLGRKDFRRIGRRPILGQNRMDDRAVEPRPPQVVCLKEASRTAEFDALIPLIEASVMHQSLEAKPDVDGEERILVSDVVLELDMKFFREEEYDLITDVYTPIRECVPEGKNEVLERLLVRNFSRCRISDRIQVKETQGKVLQLCHSQGKVKIDKTRIVENGVQADGVVMLKILYIIGNDDMPFYSMEAMIPFSHMVEARGIRQDSCYQLKAKLEQLSAAMADGNEIEIRATVGLELLAVAREPVFIIEKVEEKPLDMKKLQAMPGILVYMVKPGDELWDIARKYHTSIQEIRTINALKENQEPSPGTPLLVVKKVEGQIK